MATLLSNIAKTSFRPSTRPQGPAIKYPFTLAVATAPALGDILKLGKIPVGATLLEFFIDIPDLDTDGTGAVSIEVGDNGSSARFLAATTAPKTARTVVSTTVITASQMLGTIAGTLPRLYATGGDLRITIAVASLALSAAVTIRGWYEYTMFPTRKDFGQ